MRRILRALRDGGVAHAARVVRARINDRWLERRLRIHSAGLIPIETLIDQYADCHDYFPTTFECFRTVMNEVAVRAGTDTFLDYGSGKGRTLILAAAYPFRRVLGVEIAPELTEVARQNIVSCRVHMACTDVEIWTGSAADYAVPGDVTVAFFYNPFHGRILRSVLANLRRSLDATPRRVTVIYNNPIHFLRIASEYPWLVERRRFHFEHACIVYDAQ